MNPSDRVLTGGSVMVLGFIAGVAAWWLGAVLAGSAAAVAFAYGAGLFVTGLAQAWRSDAQH